MSEWRGSFNERGDPVMSIEVLLGTARHTLQAIIDTGYSGFLIVPLSKLKQLPSFLEDVKMLTLADGRKIVRLQANASIRMGEEIFHEVATIESEGEDVIIGMKFLHVSKRSLHVFPITNKVLFQTDD